MAIAITFVLAAVAVCAGAAAVVVFAVALYVAWRCYLVLVPVRVVVEWEDDTEDGHEQRRKFLDAVYGGAAQEEHPQFDDNQWMREDQVVHRVHDGRIELELFRSLRPLPPNGVHRAIDAPLPRAVLPFLGATGEHAEPIEALEADDGAAEA